MKRILVLSLLIPSLALADNLTQMMGGGGLPAQTAEILEDIFSNAVIESFVPKTNSDVDLGTAALSWEDLFAEKGLFDNDSTSAPDADVTTATAATPLLTAIGTSATQSHAAFVQNVASAQGVEIDILKTRAAAGSTNANTVVSSGDDLGMLTFWSADGAAYGTAVRLLAEAGAASGSTDTPGKFSILISADGSSTLTEAINWGPTGLQTNAAGITMTAGDLTVSSGDVFVSAQDKQLQILSGVASVDADVVTAAPDTSTVAYLGSNTSGNRLAMVSNIADAVGGTLAFYKTRAAANAWNANTIIASGDDIGEIIFYGSDGAEFIAAARIIGESGGTPGLTTDMPGSLIFQTVPDGSASLTSALTIEPDQDLLMTGDLYLADGQNLGFTAASGANAACDTTCTTGCVMGYDTGGSVFVGCASAAADTCICTK